jgi:hypothetical protein
MTSESQTVARETPAASIGVEVDRYIRHIDSLRNTLPGLMILVQEAGKKSREEVDTFEKDHCEVSEETENRKRVIVPMEHYTRWQRLMRINDGRALAHFLVQRSIFVSLISQYDAFLGRLLRAIFILRPEQLNASEKQLTYSQLATFPNMEAAREFVIEKEVETVLRSSHADHFKWMEHRFALPLTKGLGIWPQFIEITERRNLFVHTDGVVSRQYLAVCKEHGCPLDADTKEGTPLYVPQKYFEASHECLFEIGVKLAHVLWRKLLPDDRPEADSSFIGTTFELIERGRYRLACALLDFACQDIKKFSSEREYLICVVNRAQAHKWQGESQMALDVMRTVDWSAKGNEFRLADAVLGGRWEEAAEIMVQIGATGAVTKQSYRDWPLFKELREQSVFLTTYEKVFGSPFDVPVTREVTKNAPTVQEGEVEVTDKKAEAEG